MLAEPKGMLYYFKSVDDPPHYKGLINMREANVGLRLPQHLLLRIKSMGPTSSPLPWTI